MRSIADTVGGLKTTRGIRIQHHLGIEEAREFEREFKRETTISDMIISFYRDTSTRFILGIEETGDLKGRRPFRYAYLNADGSLLPDFFAVGKITALGGRLQYCYNKLTEGLERINR
ncbi:hypothetical protein HYY71_02530 [Candidatus Woesearchaeota archaeon]|nr:hypothetical protein [Candidatus Woesearchaeota archaeon]